MKKLWKIILGIGAALFGIFALIASNKKKTPKKVLENNKKIDELQVKLETLQADKIKAEEKVASYC